MPSILRLVPQATSSNKIEPNARQYQYIERRGGLITRPCKGIISNMNWSTCSAVEQDEARVSGAWVFRGTRVPVIALFENLEAGATVDDFLSWFPGVNREQVETVLDHTIQSLRQDNQAA
jgi:uncharacterized protein (DUF433 family)